jgi:hypothetical protein
MVLLNVNVTKLFRNFYAIKAIKTFSLRKRHPPPPCRLAWKFQGKLTKFYYHSVILHIHAFDKFSQVSENFKCFDASRQNLFSNFVDLTRLAYLPRLILQPSVASTMIFYEFSHEPLALLSEHICREKFSSIRVKKFLNNCHTHSLDCHRH